MLNDIENIVVRGYGPTHSSYAGDLVQVFHEYRELVEVEFHQVIAGNWYVSIIDCKAMSDGDLVDLLKACHSVGYSLKGDRTRVIAMSFGWNR